MYLKSLTLKGFKSFADKTAMVYDPGLTVVVGPNGSGKSNVSDAILWVLGEQSAKMLRGQAMEDVIFSGSSARQPVGLAEVTLVLDNSDHTIPVDFDEVGITRRMYRSGESEYLINGAPARLMDIQDILHDSGLGKETHSIISQGKLDSVLSSRPEERRALIEEAAGISKHRRRKERSQRKLKSMDENLVRAKDIEREIIRHLRPLERQVVKARRAAEFEERLRECSAILAVDDLRKLQLSWDELKARLREDEAAVEIAQYKLSEKQSELDKLQSLLEEKGLFVGDLGEQRRRMQEVLSRVDSDMRLLEEKGKNMVDRLSEMRRSLSATEHRRREATSQLEAARLELAEVRGSTEHLEGEVSRLGPEADAARDARAAIDERQAQLAADARAAQRTADEETLAYVRLKEQLSGAEVEDSMYASRIAQLDEAIATCEAALEAAIERRDATSAELGRARERVASANEAIAAHQGALQDAEAALGEARAELSQASGSLQALSAADAAVETQSPRVAALAADDASSSLIRCRLADLIEAPPELEGIVERLLGEDLAALVVEGADELMRLGRAALSAADGGRATLVSMAGAARHTERAQGERLVDSLKVEDSARDLIEALLGDVMVSDSLDSALAAHADAPGLTHVSADGCCVLPDGRVVVGATAGGAAGSLERKRRIRALEGSVPKLESALADAEQHASDERDALSRARDELATAQGEQARISGELSSAKSEITRLEAQRDQAASERSQVARRREESGAKAAEARPKLEAHKQAADEAAARVSEAGVLAEQLAAERTSAREAEEASSRALAEARLSLATARERRRNLEARAEEFERTERDLARRHEATLKSSRSLEVLRLRVGPLHARYVAIREVAQGWAVRLADRASLAEADSDSLKRTIGDARASVETAREALDAARASAEDRRVEAGKLEVQVQSAVEAITGEGGYVLEEALELPAPEDRPSMEREVGRLRRQLAEIGPVNQVAMDEYARLKERADYISEQVGDLEAARTSLTKIMAAIDRKMRQAFLVTFDAVNDNFSEVFGMLFPGGQAHLELTDPDHLSETGIEIIAQPRGKRLAKMTLMSGGEKSLTALALLFAVYRTRTVPFYVFDEVEAALDDSNLDKLLGAIEQLKETTQLIVISHQRRTMEQADVLYGVSMQADGVSHVVSQRLDRATGKVVDA